MDSGFFIVGSADPVEAILNAAELHARIGVRFQPFADLIDEGVATLRAALDRPGPAPKAPPGTFWGDPRGMLVADIILLTPIAVETLRRRPAALRAYARGVALIDEALRWYADAIENACRESEEERQSMEQVRCG